MNAIIMAAGMSARFAPLSFEKPKGLLKVKGEVLVERQIRQLQEAGISDITLVVGYKAEMFSYLKDKMDVDIVVNEDYYRYNNTSSLIRVVDRLDNTFVCSSDNYFTENVFLEEPKSAYYAAVYQEGITDEWCIRTNDKDIITSVEIGGKDSWYMCGHVFFDHEFSSIYRPLLLDEYETEECKNMLWEDLYIKHIANLKMKIKKYNRGIIQEFDSLEDLRSFDDTYINNTGSAILQSICEDLHCEEKDIVNVKAIKKGTQCESFTFEIQNIKYEYNVNCKHIKRIDL